ncbi:hypothetical protein WICPIJ_008933, partial [Wickerhamomyces pijperi]
MKAFSKKGMVDVSFGYIQRLFYFRFSNRQKIIIILVKNSGEYPGKSAGSANIGCWELEPPIHNYMTFASTRESMEQYLTHPPSKDTMAIQLPITLPQLKLTKSLQRLLAYLGLTILTLIGLFFYVRAYNPSQHHHPSIKFNLRSFDPEYLLQEPSYITAFQVVTCHTFWRCVAPKSHDSKNKLDQGQWTMINKPLSYSRSLLKPSSLFSQKYFFVEKTPVSKLQVGKDLVVTGLNVYSHRMITFDLEPFTPSDAARYYHDLDILYGVDSVEVRPGWERLEKPYYAEMLDTDEMSVYLTVKKEDNGPPQQQTGNLVRKTDEYKILQVADLHYATGTGTCRDQFPVVENCQADPRTLQFLHRVLDHEKPDLVVLTGDQIFGEDSFDSETTLMKVVKPFIQRQIPYMFTFGNHDDEGSLSRLELFQLLQTLPFFHGPERALLPDAPGVGNMITQVVDESNTPSLTIYLLDSHKYTPDQKLYPGYDWVKESQLEYIKSQQPKLLEPKDPKQHTSLAFLHIPLPEYRLVHSNPGTLRSGQYKEGITAPYYNSGALKLFHDLGVRLVSVGHDHCNDFCIEYKEKEDDKVAMSLCYGGAVGEGGYAGYGGTERRLRVWNFKWQGQTGVIMGETWKWLETDTEMK